MGRPRGVSGTAPVAPRAGSTGPRSASYQRPSASPEIRSAPEGRRAYDELVRAFVSRSTARLPSSSCCIVPAFARSVMPFALPRRATHWRYRPEALVQRFVATVRSEAHNARASPSWIRRWPARLRHAPAQQGRPHDDEAGIDTSSISFFRHVRVPGSRQTGALPDSGATS